MVAGASPATALVVAASTSVVFGWVLAAISLSAAGGLARTVLATASALAGAVAVFPTKELVLVLPGLLVYFLQLDLFQLLLLHLDVCSMQILEISAKKVGSNLGLTKGFFIHQVQS